MKKTKLLATILITGMLVTGCGFFGGNTVIKINDQKITQREFNKAMDKQISMSPFAKMGGDVKANKDSMLYLMSEKAVLNRLIIQNILDTEMKNRGIKADSKDVNEAINKIIDKLGSKEQLNALLKDNGMSIKDFKADIANQVKLRKMAQQAADTNVSDSEVKAYYDNNKDLFTHKEQVRASHILLQNNPTQIKQELQAESKKELSREELASRADKIINTNNELAQKLVKELTADNSKFAKYAKKYSKDIMSAQRGGDLGYFERERMVPEFSKAAFEAKPNTVVGPVQSPFGLHIIMVTDRKAAGVDSFDKVKSDIKERLQTEKELKAIESILEAAKKKAKIEYASDDYNPEKVEQKLQIQMQGLQKSLTQPANK